MKVTQMPWLKDAVPYVTMTDEKGREVVIVPCTCSACVTPKTEDCDPHASSPHP